MTDFLLALVGIAAAAAWACSAGTLPGRSLPILGPLMQGLAWAGLYAGLVAVYRPTATRHGAPGRALIRRLALSLLLALAATHGLRLLAGAMVAPSVWDRFFYVQWLAPAATVLLALAALLPRTTGTVIRDAMGHPAGGLLLGLAVLLATAAVLTAGADLAFEWHAVDARLRREIVLPSAWVTNTLLLCCAYALVFAVTSRVAAAQLLVTPVYLLLAAGTLVKIEFMHSAVQPLDLLRLPEFVPLFPRFFGTPVLAVTVLGIALWLGALATVRRRTRYPLSPGLRLSLGLGALAVLLGVGVMFDLAPRVPAVNRVLIGLGAPSDLHREKARANGLLLSFLSEIPAAAIPRPPDYSREAVAAALTRSAPPPTPSGHAPHVNLVVYLIESFMDPNDLGLRYTSDPIPHIRAAGASHIATHAIVPERFGGSANTEFELLSGMTMAFLPRGSLPFRQYIRRPQPSLPRALSELGYVTTAVQADAKYYYNREQVYAALGFRHVVWLNDTTGVERAPRPGWPSDAAVVRAVIDASRGPRPFFVFAFPSSTHSPYNSGTFRGSDLDVVNPVPSDTAGEVKEYINALRDADAAVGTMIEYFGQQPDSIVIAILGDHLAPLSGSALGPLLTRLSALPEPEQSLRSRRVPLVIWANFPLPAGGGELSVNALPSFLLEKMGIVPAGFLGLTGEVRRRMPVVGPYVTGLTGNIRSWDSIPGPERILLEDYRLLQYDLLLGRQYALGDGTTAPPSRSLLPDTSSVQEPSRTPVRPLH